MTVMAICPFAELQLLPENRTQGRLEPTQVVVHTADDAPGLTRLWRYFWRSDVTVESHFYVTKSGRLVQMIDTGRRADAQSKGNGQAISIETEDDGRPLDPWTPAQVATLVRLGRWIVETHDRVPAEMCTRWDRPGFGWHSMWNWPNDPIGQTGRWVPSPWTTVRGKICPGKTRIGQWVDVVVPAVGTNGDELTTKGSGVNEADVKDIQALLNEHFDARLKVDGKFGRLTRAAVSKARSTESGSVTLSSTDAAIVATAKTLVASGRRLFSLIK